MLDFVNCLSVVFEYCYLDTLEIIQDLPELCLPYTLYENRTWHRLRHLPELERCIRLLSRGCWKKVSLEVCCRHPFEFVEMYLLFEHFCNLHEFLKQSIWHSLFEASSTITQLDSRFIQLDIHVPVFEAVKDHVNICNYMRTLGKYNKYIEIQNHIDDFYGNVTVKHRNQSFFEELKTIPTAHLNLLKYALPFESMCNHVITNRHEFYILSRHFDASVGNQIEQIIISILQRKKIPESDYYVDACLIFSFLLASSKNPTQDLLFHRRRIKNKNTLKFVDKLLKILLKQNNLSQIFFDLYWNASYETILPNTFVIQAYKNSTMFLLNLTLFVYSGYTVFAARPKHVAQKHFMALRYENVLYRFLIRQMTQAQLLQFIDLFPECLNATTYVYLKKETNDTVVAKCLRCVDKTNASKIKKIALSAAFENDLIKLN